MSIIYIPRVIETAEQAAALPEGAIAVAPDDRPDCVRQRWGVDRWYDTDEGGYRRRDVNMIGWSVLTPVTAGVEHAVIVGSERSMTIRVTDPEPAPGAGSITNLPRVHRYVTAWEDA